MGLAEERRATKAAEDTRPRVVALRVPPRRPDDGREERRRLHVADAVDVGRQDYDDDALPALAPRHDACRPRRPVRNTDATAPPGTDAESCACCARFDVTVRAHRATHRATRRAAESDDESEGSPEDLEECGMCE